MTPPMSPYLRRGGFPDDVGKMCEDQERNDGCGSMPTDAPRSSRSAPRDAQTPREWEEVGWRMLGAPA